MCISHYQDVLVVLECWRTLDMGNISKLWAVLWGKLVAPTFCNRNISKQWTIMLPVCFVGVNRISYYEGITYFTAVWEESEIGKLQMIGNVRMKELRKASMKISWKGATWEPEKQMVEQHEDRCYGDMLWGQEEDPCSPVISNSWVQRGTVSWEDWAANF